MKSSAKSINLTSLDDLFSTEESRAEESCEKVVRIPLAELHPFPNHPFHVRDDEAMQNTVDSIKEYGVLTPGIVRPREDGGYEIVAGHRRKHGSELAGLSDMPCIVREMDDDSAEDKAMAYALALGKPTLLIHPNTWKKKWLNVVKREGE